MRSSVELSRSAAGEVVSACLAGDVDMVQVPKIQGALEAALADDASGLIIDLSAVQSDIDDFEIQAAQAA